MYIEKKAEMKYTVHCPGCRTGDEEDLDFTEQGMVFGGVSFITWEEVDRARELLSPLSTTSQVNLTENKE